ncbi:sulfite exporter TauE/SafE family protein, partial [Nocardioides sp.]|uniref:sulfite exporter TauE/SafE family protein n=1 Tax=Nocardioides sp. TaxID=35761 RepID=UPI002EDAB0EA
MTGLEAVALGLAIGLVLGGLGGGGAILTVPALVYLLDQPAQAATTGSLVIVGLSALTGMASYVSDRQVRWRLGLTFGLVGLPATWAGSLLNHRVDEDVLLLGFAALMIAAAIAMLTDRVGRRAAAGDDPEPPEP